MDQVFFVNQVCERHVCSEWKNVIRTFTDFQNVYDRSTCYAARVLRVHLVNKFIEFSLTASLLTDLIAILAERIEKVLFNMGNAIGNVELTYAYLPQTLALEAVRMK